MPAPSSYAEFRKVFYAQFWSSEIQRKARNDVFRPYRYENNTGLASHAMKWISNVKYLSPPIDQID